MVTRAGKHPPEDRTGRKACLDLRRPGDAKKCWSARAQTVRTGPGDSAQRDDAMALSDYEQRVLRNLEIQLTQPRRSWRARIGAMWCSYERAVVIGALATVMIVLVFAVGAAIAPIAGLLCAMTGYYVAMARRRWEP